MGLSLFSTANWIIQYLYYMYSFQKWKQSPNLSLYFFLLLFTLFSTSKLFYIVGINEFRGNLPKREFCQGSTSGCYFINILRACLLSNETGNSYSKFILTENLLVQREFSIVESWGKVHFWKGRYGRSFYGT